MGGEGHRLRVKNDTYVIKHGRTWDVDAVVIVI